MKKRLLSIVTATAMTLTALPLTVNAAEISDYINSTNDELAELFNGFEVSNDYETDKSIILTDNETQLMRLYDKNIMSLIYYPSDINDVQEINKMIRKAFPKSYSSTFDNEDEIEFYFNSYGYIEIDTISGTQEQFKQLSDEITSKFVVKKIIIKTIDYTGDLFEGKHGETLFSGVTSKIVNLYSENVLYSTENENEETLKAETYINTQALAVNIYNATTTTTVEPITTDTPVTKDNGDANCDGNVNMADAVMIMQSLANPDKYGVNGTDETHITAQGEKNGDMDGNGLTNADALEIQKMLLKIS